MGASCAEFLHIFHYIWKDQILRKWFRYLTNFNKSSTIIIIIISIVFSLWQLQLKRSKSKSRLNLNSLLLSNQLHLTTLNTNLKNKIHFSHPLRIINITRGKKSPRQMFIFREGYTSTRRIHRVLGWALRVEQSQIRRLSFRPATRSFRGAELIKFEPQFRGCGSQIRRANWIGRWSSNPAGGIFCDLNAKVEYRSSSDEWTRGGIKRDLLNVKTGEENVSWKIYLWSYVSPSNTFF